MLNDFFTTGQNKSDGSFFSNTGS